jgi:hypothetical protein
MQPIAPQARTSYVVKKTTTKKQKTKNKEQSRLILTTQI